MPDDATSPGRQAAPSPSRQAACLEAARTAGLDRCSEGPGACCHQCAAGRMKRHLIRVVLITERPPLPSAAGWACGTARVTSATSARPCRAVATTMPGCPGDAGRAGGERPGHQQRNDVRVSQRDAAEGVRGASKHLVPGVASGDGHDESGQDEHEWFHRSAGRGHRRRRPDHRRSGTPQASRSRIRNRNCSAWSPMLMSRFRLARCRVRASGRRVGGPRDRSC
jgi:hypothetical protein